MTSSARSRVVLFAFGLAALHGCGAAGPPSVNPASQSPERDKPNAIASI